MKDLEELVWGDAQQRAFDQIKEALSNPRVHMPPIRSKPLKLYIASEDESIDYLLAQDGDDSTKRVVYCLRRILNDAKTIYTPTYKLCLFLFYA